MRGPARARRRSAAADDGSGDLVVLRLATWNVHRGRGEDGVVDPARTADVLAREVAPEAADALLLQEADEEADPQRGFLDLAGIEARTGLRSAHAREALRWGEDSDGFHGNVVLLADGLEVEEAVALDLPGRNHRGAVVLDLRRRRARFRLIGIHLSRLQALRVAQMRTIGQHLARRSPRPLIVAGDTNEWRPWGGLAFGSAVVGRALTGPARATFPTPRPLLPLDRVLAADGAIVERTSVLDGPGIRSASDHRPLAARVRLT